MGVKKDMKLVLAILAVICASVLAGKCTTWSILGKQTTVTCPTGQLCAAYEISSGGTGIASQGCAKAGSSNGKCVRQTVTSGGKSASQAIICSNNDIGNGPTSPAASIKAATC